MLEALIATLEGGFQMGLFSGRWFTEYLGNAVLVDWSTPSGKDYAKLYINNGLVDESNVGHFSKVFLRGQGRDPDYESFNSPSTTHVTGWPKHYFGRPILDPLSKPGRP